MRVSVVDESSDRGLDGRPAFRVRLSVNISIELTQILIGQTACWPNELFPASTFMPDVS